MRLFCCMIVCMVIGFSCFADEIGERFEKAIFFSKMKEYDKAVQEYETIIQLDPQNTLAYLQLGNIAAIQRQYKRAINAYKQVITLQSNNFAAHYQLGLLYADKKEYDRAIFYLLKAQKIESRNSRVYYHLGLVYSAKDDYNKAIDAFKNCIERDPYHYKARIALGGALFFNGDKALAYKQIQMLKTTGRKDEANALSNWMNEEERKARRR